MARTVRHLPAVLRLPGKRQPDTRSPNDRTSRFTSRLPAALRPPRERDGRGRPPVTRHALALPLRLLAMLVAFVCMVAFAVALARITLEPSPASVHLTHSNLHPGRSLRAYVEQARTADAVRQIGGNVLLGVPFGVLVPVLAPRARGVLPVLALTALVMLMVELTQGALVTGRAFDIDDVLLNTAGALLGWLLLGRRLGRAVHRRVRHPET
ncbi:VanZ family protein [Streptomyces filipinensis]|uniref:VanZ family protein n=1 Tax=Streptomyces filipinensis TaxID=66887 RepID=A0A918IIJ4_9ACTN|nr:VanZ family protein [Streptomyces filipinensis]GGV14168.1 VanZ family protein [Streptomyces filipinensis]